jgi:transcriptional regulator with XRE-family HTH domain
MPPRIKIAGIPKPPRVPDAVKVRAQGERIGLLRQIMDWSNKEMAHRLGVKQATLSQYIYGRKKSISTRDIWRLAQITGTETNFIISGETKYLNTLWHQRLRKKGQHLYP